MSAAKAVLAYWLGGIFLAVALAIGSFFPLMASYLTAELLQYVAHAFIEWRSGLYLDDDDIAARLLLPLFGFVFGPAFLGYALPQFLRDHVEPTRRKRSATNRADVQGAGSSQVELRERL